MSAHWETYDINQVQKGGDPKPFWKCPDCGHRMQHDKKHVEESHALNCPKFTKRKREKYFGK